MHSFLYFKTQFIIDQHLSMSGNMKSILSSVLLYFSRNYSQLLVVIVSRHIYSRYNDFYYDGRTTVLFI